MKQLIFVPKLFIEVQQKYKYKHGGKDEEIRMAKSTVFAKG